MTCSLTADFIGATGNAGIAPALQRSRDIHRHVGLCNVWRHFRRFGRQATGIQAILMAASNSYVSINTYSGILHDERIQFICISLASPP